MGKTYNDIEKTVWIARWAASYNPPIADIPDQKTIIQTNASAFISSPSSEYITDVLDTQQINKGHKLVGAAFQYLMDSTNGTALHDHIVNQVGEIGVDYTQYYGAVSGGGYTTAQIQNLNFSSWWVCKFYLAFDYCRDLFSAGEITTIQAWLNDTGKFFLEIQNRQLSGVIPNRNDDGKYDDITALLADQGSHTLDEWYYSLDTNRNYQYNGTPTGSINDYSIQTTAKRDYNTFAGVGNNGASYSPVKYTYYNNSDVAQNEIVQFHGYFSNQRAVPYRVVGLIGVEIGEPMMIDHAKLFYEEVLKYATFSDGTDSEYRRNGDSSYVMQGVAVYSLLVIECLITIADALLRNGYEDYFVYSTTDGKWGTEGSTKNLRLMIDEVINHCTVTYNQTDSKYYSSKLESNLLDTVSDTDSRRFLSETILSKANRYPGYNEQVIEDCYMLVTSGSNIYGSPSVISGVHPWGGSLQALPSAAFLDHEMEGVYVYPPYIYKRAKQGARALLF